MAHFYRPPADIDDFSRRPASADALRANWHAFISDAIQSRAGSGLFYDAEFDPAPGTAPARRPIPWNGFPRSLWQWFNADSDPAGAARALAAAETLRSLGEVRFASGDSSEVFARQQDEYCEWHVDRDANSGAITRIAFTCEGPEYYQRMAEVDLSLVGDLYREHVNPDVQDDDLVWPDDVVGGQGVVFPGGSYNRWNKWNTQLGAMHLTHQANTLGAEINLAADATVQFPVPAAPANTLPFRLICCARFGGVNRSSDPLIGVGVNGLAGTGLSVTLDNPVGLYIQDVNLGGLRDPQGIPIGPEALRIVRASPDGKLVLRAEVAPPAGATFTLDQCTFEGEPLRSGGQMARRITMVLFGLAKAIPGRTAQQRSCSEKCCRKPDTSGFLKGVPTFVNCSSLTAADFEEDAPVEPGAILSVSPGEVRLEELLAPSRAAASR